MVSTNCSDDQWVVPRVGLPFYIGADFQLREGGFHHGGRVYRIRYALHC